MNLPNKLTILRIALVPVVVAVYLCVPADAGIVNAATGLGLRNLLVLIIFALASITDYLDGMLARKTTGSRRLENSPIRLRTRCS